MIKRLFYLFIGTPIMLFWALTGSILAAIGVIPLIIIWVIAGPSYSEHCFEYCLEQWVNVLPNFFKI